MWSSAKDISCPTCPFSKKSLDRDSYMLCLKWSDWLEFPSFCENAPTVTRLLWNNNLDPPRETFSHLQHVYVLDIPVWDIPRGWEGRRLFKSKTRVAKAISKLAKSTQSSPTNLTQHLFVSSVRSCSVYHGLIEIQRSKATFSNFSIFSSSADSKVLKRPKANVCYIF